MVFLERIVLGPRRSSKNHNFLIVSTLLNVTGREKALSKKSNPYVLLLTSGLAYFKSLHTFLYFFSDQPCPGIWLKPCNNSYGSSFLRNKYTGSMVWMWERPRRLNRPLVQRLLGKMTWGVKTNKPCSIKSVVLGGKQRHFLLTDGLW